MSVSIGILPLRPERRLAIAGGLDYIAEILFAFINSVMKLAPIATFGAIACSVGSNGNSMLIALGQLIVSLCSSISAAIRRVAASKTAWRIRPMRRASDWKKRRDWARSSPVWRRQSERWNKHA